MQDEIRSAKIYECHEVTDDYIHGFFKDYRFLSNFWPANFICGEGKSWTSSEAYYQALKLPIKFQEEVRLAPVHKCKKVAYKYMDYKNPEFDKILVMKKAIYYKFSQNEDLKQKLLDTGDKELVENNWWNDTFWGKCKGEGENNLGKLLMELRKFLNKE